MSSSTDASVPVGRIGKPHGVRGEVTVLADSDNPDRFVAGAVFVTDREDPEHLELQSARTHHDRLLLKFAGVDDRDRAETLRGTILLIPTDTRRPLGEDEYWPDDLVGLTAQDPAGTRLGEVVDLVLGPQDRIVVRTDAGELVEVPFVADLVAEVAVVSGYLVIDPPDGLF